MPTCRKPFSTTQPPTTQSGAELPACDVPAWSTETRLGVEDRQPSTATASPSFASAPANFNRRTASIDAVPKRGRISPHLLSPTLSLQPLPPNRKPATHSELRASEIGVPTGIRTTKTAATQLVHEPAICVVMSELEQIRRYNESQRNQTGNKVWPNLGQIFHALFPADQFSQNIIGERKKDRSAKNTPASAVHTGL